MTKNEIRAKVIEVMEKKILLRNLPNISEDSLLREDLGLDSLIFLKYLTELEKEFGIKIADEYWDFKLLNSIKLITEYFDNAMRG